MYKLQIFQMIYCNEKIKSKLQNLFDSHGIL